MIDIHSHILWGLDDGPSTLEESEAMVRVAAAHGTTDIVATPHADDNYAFDANVVAERVAELQERAPASIRIHRGCDFHVRIDSIRQAVADPAKFSVNSLGWLLLEFNDLLIFPNTEDLFRELQSSGLRLIVTHPERHWMLQENPDRLKRWVDSGVFLQLTAQAIIGLFGAAQERFSLQLMEAGLVHFVASDAHDLQRRPPRLDQAREWIMQRFGEAAATALLVDHPRCVIEGTAIKPGRMRIKPARRRWWFKSRGIVRR